MWLYKSPIGNIFIKYIPSEYAYGTIYNGVVWECCDHPQANADNIYCQVTGCYDWDTFELHGEFVPNDLSEWIKI